VVKVRNVEQWINDRVIPKIAKQRRELPDDLYREWLIEKIDIEEGARMRAMAGRNAGSIANITRFKSVYVEALSLLDRSQQQTGDSDGEKENE
jgi:hypothetical protein